MPKNHDIHLKVDKGTKDEIRLKAEARCTTITNYIVGLTKNDTGPFENVVREIHTAVNRIKEQICPKEKNRSRRHSTLYEPAEEYMPIASSYDASIQHEYDYGHLTDG